jgi:LacI family transcriptional regulator
MPFMDRLSPPLTSLHIPHEEIGVQAAKLLLERIQDPESPVKTVNLLPQLIVRGSTARPASERKKSSSEGRPAVRTSTRFEKNR